MRTIHIYGNTIDVQPHNNLLQVQGDTGAVAAITFSMNRFVGTGDLSLLNCVLKTRDTAGHTDVSIPQVEALEESLTLLWTPTAAIASVPGALMVQLEFHTAPDAESPMVWQSCPAEFRVAGSLNGDAVFLQNPTILQQWEKKIDRVYSEVSGSIDRINELRADIDQLVSEGGLESVDAKTLNGCAVNDEGAGTDILWSAKKTADSISEGIAAIPIASDSISGLMDSDDKRKLDGLNPDGGSADASTVNGCAVNDNGSGTNDLWSAKKTADSITAEIAAIPLVSDSISGLMSWGDKRKLNELNSGGGGVSTDALTLNGCAVNDSSSGTTVLWTAKKTTDTISEKITAIPLVSSSGSGLMSSADKQKLDGLDGDNSSIDALTLNGCSVNDTGTDSHSLWTATKTAQAITQGIAGIPTASSNVSGLLSTADKQKLDGMDARFSSVNAVTLAGKAVDDTKSDVSTLWTAGKTAGAISSAIAGIPLASSTTSGMMGYLDKVLLTEVAARGSLTMEYYEHSNYGASYRFSDGTMISAKTCTFSTAINASQSPDGYWMSAPLSVGYFNYEYSTPPITYFFVKNAPFLIFSSTNPTALSWGKATLAWFQQIATTRDILVNCLAIGRC